MVGTVEQKLHATGDGAEFADYQPFVIDRIMVKYIVLFKKQLFFIIDSVFNSVYI